MAVNITKIQLSEKQKQVLNTILEDIFYLASTLNKTTDSRSLIHLARISIIFNYISLETLRNFYCEKLGLKQDKKTRNYNWQSFFKYKDHTRKIDLLLKSKKYTGFQETKDLENFIDELRQYRNLILHRSNLSNKKHNKSLENYLKNINQKSIEKLFTKSRNCIEIMNYIMEIET